MRALWIVLSREVAERRMLLAGALVLGIVPFLYLFLPGTGARAGEAAETRLQIGALLALVAMGLTALILGSTIIARDLAERRLGFYFSRPIPGWAVWGGKVLAAFALTLATGALTALPAVLAGWRSLSRSWSWPDFALGLALLLALLALTHAAGVILRARSPWLVLDLAAALVLPLIVVAATRQVLRYGFLSFLDLPYVVGGIVLLVVLAAGAAQVMRGRTDLRRGHRILSLVLWGGLFAVTAGYAGFCRWLLAVEPADLRQASASGAPAGPWLSLAGRAAYRGGHFLMNTDSGYSLLLPGSAFPVHFSADGRKAAWFTAVKPWSDDSSVSLSLVDLSAAKPKPISLPLTLPRSPAFELSPDGARIATIEGNRLLVYSLPRGDVLASAAIPRDPYQGRVRFVGSERVRLYAFSFESQEYDTQVLDLDIPANRLLDRGSWAGSLFPFLEPWSPDGRHLLLWGGKSARAQLVEVETGKVTELYAAAPVPSQPSVPPRPLLWSGFLADGRLVLVDRGEDRRILRVLRPGTTEERQFSFRSRFFSLGGQPAPDQLLVAISAQPEPAAKDLEIHLVDLAAGTERLLARGLKPLWGSWEAGPASTAATLFYRPGKGIVRLDLGTGRETVVLPAAEPDV